MTAVLNVQAARAEALFCSNLQPSDHPSAAQVKESIAAMVRLHGSANCTAIMSAAYGKYPEAAAERMAWAVYMVGVAYPRRHQHTKRYRWCQACQYTPERVAQIHAEVREAKKVAAGEPSAPALTAAEVIALLGLDGTDQS